MPMWHVARLATAIGAGLLAAAAVHRVHRAARAPSTRTAAPIPARAPDRNEAAAERPADTPNEPAAPVGARVTPPTRPADAFRPDVEGLRGIAILLVVLFHMGLPVPGGFVGVDVFFVISGFLITGMLIREVERTGTIALGRFFARRLRRLLPAAAVALAVTLPLAYLALAPLDRLDVMTDGAAAILSVANVRFALAEGDYFAAVTGPSPFLHFWSLSLEEQFYLLWPLLLLIVARGRRPRLAAAVALGLVLVVSLAMSIVVTGIAAGWSFYALPARAWQFAAGGSLALVLPLLPRLPGLALVAVGWAGAIALAASTLTLGGGQPYPGILAVIPTAGAVALIAAGERRLGPGLLLRRAPLRFLGRISYSLYLWHWPILVLPVIAMGQPLVPGVAVALAAVSIVVAWASWAQVERRFHTPMAPGRSATVRPLATSGVAIALVAALALGLGTAAAAELGAVGTATDDTTLVAVGDTGPIGVLDGLPAGDLVRQEPEHQDPTATPGPRPSPPADRTGDEPVPSPPPPPAPPTPSPRPSPPAGWTLTIPDTDPAEPIPLPRDVEPSLAGARSDIERLFADGCITQTSGTKPEGCVYGARDGTLTIALVGDSHASQWFPAFNVLATRHGWRLLPFVKVSCPFVDMPVYNPRIKREYTECATWRGRVIEDLNEISPDLVVVTSGYRAIVPLRNADATVARQGAAMSRAVAALEMPVAILIDSPRASFDIPGCLSRHRDDVRACAIPRRQAFPAEFGQREMIAARETGASLLDLVGSVCPSAPCQVVRDGRILYRDNHHLTATFVRSLAGPLEAALAPVLRPVPADGATADQRS